ncbi:hypothetical protein [Thiomicrorhabdus sp.]|nr:hypothetical protein [Thiomicrorhabdus sp.]
MSTGLNKPKIILSHEKSLKNILIDWRFSITSHTCYFERSEHLLV